MNVLLVVATKLEIDQEIFHRIINSSKHQINILVTGIGVPSTLYNLSKYVFLQKTETSSLDLIINIGIAGSFKDDLNNGEVIQVVEDTYADIGFEEQREFKHISEIINTPIFYKNNYLFDFQFKNQRGITVNTVTDDKEKILSLIEKFNPEIETMESAAIFDFCLKENIPFIVIRAISNKVGERDKSKWHISLAVHNLWLTLYNFLNSLDK
ncbi:MAG: phosphorylase family protein [Bacteroidales bacterium]